MHQPAAVAFLLALAVSFPASAQLHDNDPCGNPPPPPPPSNEPPPPSSGCQQCSDYLLYNPETGVSIKLYECIDAEPPDFPGASECTLSDNDTKCEEKNPCVAT